MIRIFCRKDLGWVNPGTHLQSWFLLETGQDEGHAHGEADEGRRHDDLAQDALLVPLAVVEPFDLQGGHMLQDQPKSEMCCPCPSLEQILVIWLPFTLDDSELLLNRVAAPRKHLLVRVAHWHFGVCGEINLKISF